MLGSGSWACLEMYNQNNAEHHKSSAGATPMMSPRISFSNDFVESQSNNSHAQQIRAAAAYRDAPVSSDFEFSVSNHSMMSADELFFKGRLLPLKESCSSKTTTLRDELLQNDNNEDEGGGFASRPPKNPAATRWRGFLGLRKSKSEKPIDKRPPAFHDKNSQGFVD